MATEASSESESDEYSNDAPSTAKRDEAYDGGFCFTDEQLRHHRVESAYSIRHIDELTVEDGTVRKYRDDEGGYPFESKIQCDCGETFPDDDAARKHLERARRRHQHRVPPLRELPNEVSWVEETTAALHSNVTVYPDEYSHLGKVVDGMEYIEFGTVESFKPPADYAFDIWSPVRDGGHFNVDGQPVLSTTFLEQAMATLTGRAYSYDPEEYSVYSLGMGYPACVTDGDDAILIAPRDVHND